MLERFALITENDAEHRMLRTDGDSSLKTLAR